MKTLMKAVRTSVNGRSPRRRFQRGDTIVEVLICVLIVSMILSGAYVTTQRSSTGIRNSQEHAEALKLIQSQLEQIKANASDETPEVFTVTATTFCMVEGEPLNADDAKCKQDSAGEPTTEQPTYEVQIRRTDSGSEAKFEVGIAWDSVTGSEIRAEEKMFYRLHR